MTLLHRVSTKKTRAGTRALFLVSDRCFPQTIVTLRSRAEPLGIDLQVGPFDRTTLDTGAYGALLQYPDEAGLLEDLARRGLLEDTLVVWGAEFGRTPMVENGDGRNHHPQAFTMWLAGGGVRGGLTFGSTDDFGYRPVENPVHMHDLHATLLYTLGLDHERLTYRHAGRDFRLTDVYGNVVRDILV